MYRFNYLYEVFKKFQRIQRLIAVATMQKGAMDERTNVVVIIIIIIIIIFFNNKLTSATSTKYRQ